MRDTVGLVSVGFILFGAGIDSTWLMAFGIVLMVWAIGLKK